MLVRELYAEMKAYNRQLALYPEVHKKYPDGTIAYERIKPLNEHMMIWSPKYALHKIWGDKFIEHDGNHILSTEEEFLSFCEEIEAQEVINRPNKSLKSNTEYSSKKSGTNIGCSSSMPQS